MKFTLLKESFEDRLALAARFTSSRVSAVLSIQGAYIKASGKEIAIITTNLSDFFHTSLSAKIETEGTVVFDVKKALEFMNFLQPGEITIELVNNTVSITQGKTQGFFNIYPEGDFPELPKIEGKKSVLPAALLEKLPLVLFSASKDETRPVMTGIYVTSDEGKNYFVTTDGFRLSLLEFENPELYPQIIMPATVLQEAIRLSKKGEDVSMVVSPEDKLVQCLLGDITIYSRVIEGEFPPYEKVIPKEATTTITVKVDEFMKNIRLISVFARDQADVVILDISKGGFFMRPKSSQQQNSQVFQEAVSVEGSDLKIAFNYKYILDFLNTITADELTIELTQPAAPGAFKPTSTEGYVHIIMPLRTDETTG